MVREPQVPGIHCFDSFGFEAGQLVGPGKDNVANQRLHRPSVFGDEAGSEMIEQFRMSGFFAIHAKVVRRAHDPLSEKVKPDPIGNHAGGVGMIRSGNPPSQFQSATLFLRNGTGM